MYEISWVQQAEHVTIWEQNHIEPVCFMGPNRNIMNAKKNVGERSLESAHIHTNHKKGKILFSVKNFKPEKGNT